MTIERILLDPNAQAYTDDEIVGKVNTATVKITREDSVEVAAVLESATEKLMSDVEKTKLDGIAAGAEVNPADTDELAEGTTNKYDTGAPPSTLEELPDGATRKAMEDAEKAKLTGIEENAKDDQSGAEIRDAVVALDDLDRKIVITHPLSGEYKIIAVQVASNNKIAFDKDDVAEE